MNSRACVTPFCPTVASSTSSTSCGAPGTSRAAMRRILSSSFIRLTRVCSRPAVSTRIGSRPFALPDEIASNTTAAGSAPSRARTMSTPARVRPDLELLDGSRAKRVGGANERRLALALQQVRELADRRRLAGAVDADDQRHLRMMGDRDRPIDGGEDATDFLLHEIAQARAVARLCRDGGDDAVGGGDADVGRDQQLFERVDRVDVDGTRPPLRRVGEADDLVEALDDLLFGAGKTLADPAEQPPSRLTRLTDSPVSASARWRRSISASRAVRTSDRPASTSAICVAIGSSTP